MTTQVDVEKIARSINETTKILHKFLTTPEDETVHAYGGYSICEIFDKIIDRDFDDPTNLTQLLDRLTDLPTILCLIEGVNLCQAKQEGNAGSKLMLGLIHYYMHVAFNMGADVALKEELYGRTADE